MTAILPLIMGALAVGVISIFKLQTGVATRLGDTSDSQMVSAVFANDVSGAQYVTTDPTSTPQCGAGIGTQLLGLEANFDSATGKFGVTTSYVRVAVTTGSTTTYNLERLVCTGEGVTTPTAVSTLAYDFAPTEVPSISCTTTSAGCPGDATTKWMSTLDVGSVNYNVTQPNTGYTYNLAASPVNSVSSTSAGAPVTLSANSTCNAALPNTGSLSTTLCFVNFAPIYNNPVEWAEATSTVVGSCLPMSVTVGSSNTLYFCLHISGAPVTVSPLPTYSQAFLGNSFCLNNLPNGTTIPQPYNSSMCLPFYTGINGYVAFYQAAKSTTNYTTTISFTQINLVNANGQSATGWHVVSADAESTDAASSTQSESITWTSDANLTPVCDGEFWDSCSSTTTNSSGQIVYGTNSYGNVDYWGNACLDDQKVVGLLQPNPQQIECISGISSGGTNEQVTGGAKNGTAIVEAVAPTQLTIQMVSPYGGLEGASFGLSVSGVNS